MTGYQALRDPAPTSHGVCTGLGGLYGRSGGASATHHLQGRDPAHWALLRLVPPDIFPFGPPFRSDA